MVLVDKPAGLTSHDVVARARRGLETSRIGHAGTLDPFATGLLVLLVGQATRLLPYLDGEPKVYDATIRFGAETTTDDCTGEVVRESPLPTPAAVDAAIARLTGVLEQVPPAFSAKKVAGRRAYAAARQGEALELAPARVTVHSWTVRTRRDDEVGVTIVCSGGTYIRALARDLGRLAGSAGHVMALRRLRSGAFDVAQAVSLAAVEQGDASLLPLRVLVSGLASQALDEDEVRRVRHGNPVSAGAHAPADGARVALVAADALIAIAERRGGVLQPKVVFGDA